LADSVVFSWRSGDLEHTVVMGFEDDVAPAPTKRRRLLRITVGVSALLVVGVVGIFALRSDMRRFVSYQFATHSPAPVSLGTAAAPASSEAAPVRLAVAGDVGTGDEAELRTASAMDDVEGGVDYDALLLLGDNVYPSGDPTQVSRTVFDPFKDVLDGGTRLLAVLGNHDVQNGNGDAQAAALGMASRWYSTTIEDVLVVSLDSTRPDDPEQLAWLAETLQSSDATWKIATMHHPAYSGGYHGSSLDVREAFSPIFERYGVQLVLAGHDHDYQRSQSINGVTYVVSGAAAKTREARRADFSVAAWSVHHFVDMGIWPDRLVLRAIDQTGNVFDEVTLMPMAPLGAE
jgi:3',5'-cyclic AMP phosphodiesterase CpdA